MFPALTHQYFDSVSPWSGLHHPLECPTELLSTILKLGLFIHFFAFLHYYNMGSTLSSQATLFFFFFFLPSYPVWHLSAQPFLGIKSVTDGLPPSTSASYYASEVKVWVSSPNLIGFCWGWTDLFFHCCYPVDSFFFFFL